DRSSSWRERVQTREPSRRLMQWMSRASGALKTALPSWMRGAVTIHWFCEAMGTSWPLYHIQPAGAGCQRQLGLFWLIGGACGFSPEGVAHARRPGHTSAAQNPPAVVGVDREAPEGGEVRARARPLRCWARVRGLRT